MRLTDEQVGWLAERVPDARVNPGGGRPPLDERRALRGIFWVPDNGAKWKDLPREFGSKSAVHKYFTMWVKSGVFETIMRDAGRLVEGRGARRIPALRVLRGRDVQQGQGRGDGVGLTKAGKGVKIMVPVDARGLPVAVTTGSASPHESTLVQGLFEFMLTPGTPERIIGEKACHSDRLDEDLDDECIEMIAPQRRNRKRQNVTRDGRQLRRYQRRWTVERTISWFQNFRLLCIRYEKSTTLFQGFLHPGCAVILLKRIYIGSRVSRGRTFKRYLDACSAAVRDADAVSFWKTVSDSLDAAWTA